MTQLSLDGVLMTVADIVAKVQAYLGVFQAPMTNHGLWRNSVTARKEKAEEVAKFVSALIAAIKTLIGKDSQDLLFFGIDPPKERAVPTEEQKLLRVQKAKATRAERHTMGKRQKAKIHGEVPQQGNAPNPGDSKPDAKA